LQGRNAGPAVFDTDSTEPDDGGKQADCRASLKIGIARKAKNQNKSISYKEMMREDSGFD
jgi:hypothetical protein